MHKILVTFLLTCVTAFAQVQNVEVVAKNLEKNNDIVNASGDVLIFSELYLITADKAKYNTKTGDIELFGNINILRGSSDVSRSDYVFLNLKNDKGDFSPFFFLNQESGLWVRCDEAIGTPEYYLTKKSVVSSCNVENPDWKIGFSSGQLNKESSFLHLYNSVFYIKDFPVFYLPYFAFPTDKTRRTGLLRPEFGYSKGEGFVFKQPIYIAPYSNFDLELDPQIRTQRGLGIYSTFRFVDSPYSNGYITAGYFTDKDDYTTKENLRNKSHYGYEFYYDRSAIFSPLFNSNIEDGFMVDFTYLNDVDYTNLKKEESSTYDRMVTSRLNYFLRHEDNYIGAYAKYFIDTDSSNNHDTLQELPTLQYHKFTSPFLINNVQYSLDLRYHNYYRKEGVTAQQVEFNVPVTFYWALFNDAFRFSVSENIYFTRVNYDNSFFREDYGQYLRNYHTLTLYTDLSKAYESFFHKVYLGFDYIIPSFDEKKGYLDRDDFVPINTQEKHIALKFKQYFYDRDGGKLAIHTLKQPYYFDDFDSKYGPIENKIELFLTPSFTASNEVQYSHDKGKLSKSLSTISWGNEKYMASFSHTYDNDEYNNYLSFSVQANIRSTKQLFAAMQYDFEESNMKSWDIGFKQSRKCWDYRIVYRENVTPKLTSQGSASSVNKQGIYLQFNLFPIGGIRQEISNENVRILN